MDCYTPARSLALQTRLILWQTKPSALDGQCSSLLFSLANLRVLEDDILNARLGNIGLCYALWLRTCYPVRKESEMGVVGLVRGISDFLAQRLGAPGSGFEIRPQSPDQAPRTETKMDKSFQYLCQLILASSSRFKRPQDEAPEVVLVPQKASECMKFLSVLDRVVEDLFALTANEETNHTIADMLSGVMESLTESELRLTHNSGFSSKNCICEAARVRLKTLGVQVDMADSNTQIG